MNNNNKPKKPWYEKWWLWVIIVIVLFIWIGIKNSWSSSSSSDSGFSSTVSNVPLPKPKPEVNTAKAVTLGSGNFKVGRDIKPGRYVIKAVSGRGFVQDWNGDVSDIDVSDINNGAILGQTANDSSNQVTSFTTDLEKGDEINIGDSIVSASFTPTPAKRTYKTTLTAGNWVVGKDIKPGRYIIKSAGGSGNLMSDNADGDDNINSILGTSADSKTGQVTQVTADLTDGEVIRTSLQAVTLTAK